MTAMRVLACIALLVFTTAAQAAYVADRSGTYGFNDGNTIGTIYLTKLPETGRYDMRIALSVSQPKHMQGEYKGTLNVTEDRGTFHSRTTPDCVLRFVFNGDRIKVSGDTPATCKEADGFTFTHSYRKKYRD